MTDKKALLVIDMQNDYLWDNCIGRRFPDA